MGVIPSLLIYPGEQTVDWGEREKEPPVTAYFLAAEAEDEVAEPALLERQADVHEEDMAEMFLVGVVDGTPYGGSLGLEDRVALPLRGEIPEVDARSGADTGAAADGLLVPAGDEQPAVLTLAHLPEHALGRQVASHLKRHVAVKHAVERAELVVVGHTAEFHTLFARMGNAGLHLLVEPFLGGHGMERVVHFHPVHGKEASLAKVFVAEHLLRQVAQLDIQAALAPHAVGDAVEHHGEHLFAVDALFVLSLAIDAPLGKQIGGHERTAAPQRAQHVGHHTALLLGNGHKRREPRCHLANAEQLGTVEEIDARHLRQLFALGDDVHLNHPAKIINLFKMCNFFALFK